LTSAIRELLRGQASLALDGVMLCLPELERAELVPFCPQVDVIEFAAYWLVCPPRHFNRRIVRRFSDWLFPTCESHHEKARALLEGHGCSFRAETNPERIDVRPWGL
jgi:LysR family transcriptional regulator, glycine cleavage system transcriptional activator